MFPDYKAKDIDVTKKIFLNERDLWLSILMRAKFVALHVSTFGQPCLREMDLQKVSIALVALK